MPFPVFTLQVPAEPPYRSIACEVTARYVDIAGGTETQRAAFQAALTRAVDELVGDRGGDVEVSCTADPPGFEVTLKHAGRSASVRHPQPTEKH